MGMAKVREWWCGSVGMNGRPALGFPGRSIAQDGSSRGYRVRAGPVAALPDSLQRIPITFGKGSAAATGDPARCSERKTDALSYSPAIPGDVQILKIGDVRWSQSGRNGVRPLRTKLYRQSDASGPSSEGVHSRLSRLPRAPGCPVSGTRAPGNRNWAPCVEQSMRFFPGGHALGDSPRGAGAGISRVHSREKETSKAGPVPGTCSGKRLPESGLQGPHELMI